MKYLSQTDLWKMDRIKKSKPQTTNGESRILGRFRQVFPLTLFPDELIIEELRIIHQKNNGPWTTGINSIMATDIACVNATSGPFFGHVHIQSLTGGPEILIDNLSRKDVYKIRSLIEGIALASREGLNIIDFDLETERTNLLKAGNVTLS